MGFPGLELHIARMGLTFLAPTSVSVVESKSNNLFITTLSKMAQLFPYGLLLSCYAEVKIDWLLRFYFPSVSDPGPMPHYSKIADFCAFKISIAIGAGFIAMPLVIKGLQTLAKKNNWNKFNKFLEGFDKFYMALAKTANVGFLALGFALACTTGMPLLITIYFVLLLLNVYSLCLFAVSAKKYACEIKDQIKDFIPCLESQKNVSSKYTQTPERQSSF